MIHHNHQVRSADGVGAETGGRAWCAVQGGSELEACVCHAAGGVTRSQRQEPTISVQAVPARWLLRQRQEPTIFRMAW
eukprot:2440232-Rhodomonas_salina.2